MKYLSLLCLLTYIAFSAYSFPGYASSSKIETSVHRAIEILNSVTFGCSTSKKDAVLYSRIAQRIEKANVRIIIGLEESGCSPFSLGYVSIDADVIDPTYNTIHLCKFGINATGWGTVDGVAQLLIHEAIHLEMSEKDECQTTEYELKIILASGLRPFINQYVRSCGITREKLLPVCPIH